MIYLLPVFKALGPWIAGLIVVAGIWLSGYSAADKKWIKHQAVIEAQSEQVLLKASKDVEEVKNTLDISAKIIEDRYRDEQIKIDGIADANKRLLAERMQQYKGRTAGSCRAMPKDANGERSGVETTSDAWVVQPADAAELVERQREADRVLEIARALQQQLRDYREAINR